MNGSRIAWISLIVLALGVAAGAQETGNATLTLPTVLVTAEKQAEDVQRVPIGMSAFTAEMLRNAGALNLNDAAYAAPNVIVNDFSARKIAEPYIRGVGASPTSPGVTVFIDGIPQLNNQSANLEWIDVERVETLRGPQGTLYGRNTIGGAITVHSARPTETWTVSKPISVGNFGYLHTPVTVSGPLMEDALFMSVSAGYMKRDGYTENRVNGDDVDDREAVYGKGQLLWTPTNETEIRYIVWGERDRDGDYALNDLFATRGDFHQTGRDFAGHTYRDLIGQSLQINHLGEQIELTSTTGFVWWDTDDHTDLDYTANPNMTRRNEEGMWQLTQEIRIGSAPEAPIRLSEKMRLRWQAGLFAFGSQFDQDAVSDLPVFFTVQRTEADLETYGVGLFGQATLELGDRWELTAGLRGDYEHKEADITQTTEFFGTTVTTVDESEDYTNLSPRFVVACHLTDEVMAYGSVTRGYKAGGFNTNAPAGSEAFDEETNWSYELGIKSILCKDRLSINAAVFYVDWQDIQMSQFLNNQQFVANAGNATSRGVEVEIHARPAQGWEVLAGVGFIETEFLDGASLAPTLAGPPFFASVDIDGNNLPLAPSYQAHLATQYTHRFDSGLALFARGELNALGQYTYDASNMYDQDAYSLVNFRIGGTGTLGKNKWRLEFWMNNAFDTEYVPIAFPAPDQTVNPSGFVGEPGAPRTFGFTVNLYF